MVMPLAMNPGFVILPVIHVVRTPPRSVIPPVIKTRWFPGVLIPTVISVVTPPPRHGIVVHQCGDETPAR